MRSKAIYAGAGAAAFAAGVAIFLMAFQQPGNVTDGAADIQQDPQDVAMMEALLDNGYPALGRDDAPITLVEFGDYQCHFCNVFFHNTKDQIITDWVDTGKVRFMFKDYTIIGPDSIVAAHGARCAEEQGLFWEYHDTVYSHWNGENNGWASLGNLRGFAQEAGLNSVNWSECMASQRHSGDITASNQDGRDLGIGGTPAFFVISPDGSVVKVSGAQPYNQFVRVFDGILEGGAQ